jgi:hypothetical protein
MRSILHRLLIFPCLLIVLAACAADPAQTIAPTSAPLPAATRTPAPPLPTRTLTPIDYAPLLAAIKDYAESTFDGPHFDLAVGFVDIASGQSISYDGDTRHYSLSTFKGPLAAYYLWLAEQGDLTPQPADTGWILPMLEISSNTATACVIQRVGGLAGFNDWLAEVGGLPRATNFVTTWEAGCRMGQEVVFASPDVRYAKGDAALDLPGASALLRCLPRPRFCGNAFAPVELARLYARLYSGEILNPDSLATWKGWIEKQRRVSALARRLPADPDLRLYIKNGYEAKTGEEGINYYNEAGIIETGYGAYAIAVFMSGNVDWPGTEPIGRVSEIVYDYFAVTHGGSKAE